MGNRSSIVGSTVDADGEFPACIFNNDKAYTEDGVLVYNLFVWNIPTMTTEDEFFEYFEKFGEVAGVHLLEGRNEALYYQRLQSGCVYYRDPVSAAKALKTTHHSMERKTIFVKACSSCNQPDGQPAAATAELLDLDDNSLDAIFKHMKMVDQVNLASCCCRLRDLFVMRAKVQYKILNLQQLECQTPSQIQNFLQMVGRYIEKLKGYVPPFNFERAIKFLGIYCINVKFISITCESLSGNTLRKLLSNMDLVEELHLRCFQLQDDSIPMLKKLKNLKTLSLDENYYLSGRKIKCLTTVETLSLYGCKAIEPIFFKEICENLTELKYLDIQRCLNLQTSSMEEIVKHLHKLETIKLSCNNDPKGYIALVPSLKNLHLYESVCGPEPPKIFPQLAKHKADQLEVLAIYSRNFMDQEMATSIGELKNLKQLICQNNENLDDNCLRKISKLQELELLDIENCNGFTSMGLFNLIKECRKLITLDVSRCPQIGEEFANNLLTLLTSDRKPRDQNKPLKVIAFESGISCFMVNSSTFQKASNKLSISC